MANIIFKRGLLSDLPATINDGHVYVTTDEKAMYIDVNSATRIRLTDVVMLTDTNQLTTMTAGVKNPNQIYITPDGKMYRWRDPGSSGALVLQPLNAAQTIDNIITSYNTSASSVSATATDPEVTTVAHSLVGSSTKQATVKYVSEDSAELHIVGTTDTQGSASTGVVTFTLSKVKTKAEISAVQNNGDAKLVIKNRDIGVDAEGTNVNVLEATGTEVTLHAGTGVTLTTQNGVITIASGGGVQSITNNYNANGDFVTTITDLNGNNVASTAISPTIQYGDTTTSAKFVNGTAALQVYTKAEVDAKIGEELRATNAMTFKGGLDVSAAASSTNPMRALPTAGVAAGDTYKVVRAGTYGGQLSKVGDMFIATIKAGANEQADGTIAAADIEWVYIPSGDETIYNYTLAYDSGSQSIQLLAGSNVVGTIKTNNDNLVIGGTGTNVTISHALVTATRTTGAAVTQTAKNTATIGVVTGVTVDDAGHVTDYTVQNLTVVDTHNAISTISFASAYAAATNTLTSTITIADRDGDQYQGEQKWSSETLQFGVNGTVGTIDLVWGSF